MIRLILPAADDVAECVEALLTAADTRDSVSAAAVLRDAALRLRAIGPAFTEAAEHLEAMARTEENTTRLAPAQAARWRALAHQLGDALDTLPQPTTN